MISAVLQPAGQKLTDQRLGWGCWTTLGLVLVWFCDSSSSVLQLLEALLKVWSFLHEAFWVA